MRPPRPCALFRRARAGASLEPMARLDHRTARLLAVVLALTAAIGFGQGLAQALRAPRPEQVSAGVDPSRDPVPNAAALTGPGLDEARVRQIAREEAAAALGVRKKAAPAPKADADDGDADAPSKPDASEPPAAPPAPAPAATSPSTPG